MQNLLGIVLSYIFIAAIIILAKFFEKFGEETSRKFIHIMLANWYFIAMYFFTNWICACIVPLSFIIINYISYKKNLIQVMERNKQDGLGTVYYAMSLFIISIFTFGILKKPELGLCPILILGYGDGFASIIGKKIKSFEYKIGSTTKTIAGSLTMLIISFILLAIYLCTIGTSLWIIKALILSIVITIVEAISIKGTDNLTVPILTFVALTLI